MLKCLRERKDKCLTRGRRWRWKWPLYWGWVPSRYFRILGNTHHTVSNGKYLWSHEVTSLSSSCFMRCLIPLPLYLSTSHCIQYRTYMQMQKSPSIWPSRSCGYLVLPKHVIIDETLHSPIVWNDIHTLSSDRKMMSLYSGCYNNELDEDCFMYFVILIQICLPLHLTSSQQPGLCVVGNSW